MTIDEILTKYQTILKNTQAGSIEHEYARLIINLCDGVQPTPPFPADYICRMVEKAEKGNKRITLKYGKVATDRTDYVRCKILLK